jgi:sporulation protein YqfC
VKKINRINELLEIPREIVSKVPKITVTGFDEVLIENYKGIMEYEDFFVRISTHIGNININGFNLKLSQMTEDDILISGKIENFDFESRRDDEL